MHPRVLALLLALAASLCGAAELPALVNVDDGNPPFMYAVNTQARGIYPALIRAAFQLMGTPVQVEAKPWKRALEEIDIGRAGVGGIYKTAERLQKYDYSDPIYVENLLVYYNVANPLVFNQIQDLTGKRIGVLRGWSYGDAFDHTRRQGLFQVEEVGSDDQNFRKLEAERIDAVIAIQESGTTLVKNYRTISFSLVPLSQNPTFLVFPKSAQRTDLLKRFDQAIRDLRRVGTYKSIITAELASSP